MDCRLLVLLSLSALAASEKRMLRASSKARMRQIPLEIPLRVPLSVPLGLDDLEDPNQMLADGPMPILALQPDGPLNSEEADRPQPLFAGMLGPESDEERPTALHAAFEPEILQSDTASPEASPHTLSANEEEMLNNLFDFGSILGAGLAHSKTGSPRMPLAADGVRVKTRPGPGVPSPLHLERRANQVRIVGVLPKHLNASSLKVNQLGHVMAVQYMLSSAVGVEQNFQLDFEPESMGEAKYQGSSGNFELVMNRPDDAAAPNNVHILFEDAPAEQSMDKTSKADSAQPAQIPDRIGAEFYPALDKVREFNFSKPEPPIEAANSQLAEDEQQQQKKLIHVPLGRATHDSIEPMHQLYHRAHAPGEAKTQEMPHSDEAENSQLAEDEQQQQKKLIHVPLGRATHDSIEPMHQLYHRAHAAGEAKTQEMPHSDEADMQAPVEVGLSHRAEDELQQQKKIVHLPLHRIAHDAIEPMHQLHHKANDDRLRTDGTDMQVPVEIGISHLTEDGQQQQKQMIHLPLHRAAHDATEPMHQLHHNSHAAGKAKVPDGLRTEVANMQAHLAEAKNELRTAFEPLPEPLVMIEVDN